MVATVGVLALQGGVEEHLRILDGLGVATRRVRVPRDVDGLDGLVIPGGESSVIDKLARSFGLVEPLRDAAAAGLSVLATCAGLIYCARELDNPAPGQQTLGLLDATVRRNAFGNQRFSEERIVPVAMGRTSSTLRRASSARHWLLAWATASRSSRRCRARTATRWSACAMAA